MKYIVLTLSLMLYSLASVAQNDIVIANSVSMSDNSHSNTNRLFNFTIEVISEVKFKYREFLREAKKHTDTFQIGKQKLTKKALIKVLRKAARTSENLEAFEKFLMNENQMFTIYLSKYDNALLYLKFRERTLDKYVDDLSGVF